MWAALALVQLPLLPLIALYPPLAKHLHHRLRFSAASALSTGEWGTLFIVDTPFFKFCLQMFFECALTAVLTFHPSRVPPLSAANASSNASAAVWGLDAVPPELRTLTAEQRTAHVAKLRSDG